MPSNPVPLAELVRRGGVYFNIAGTNPVEALTEAIRVLGLPPGIDRERLLAAVLEREKLMPTAIGNGAAIPHPRNPILSDPELQRVAVFFLKKPMPYGAPDRKPVSVLFLILSSDARSHLGTLSSLSELCQAESFIAFLASRPSTAELTARIAGLEDRPPESSIPV